MDAGQLINEVLQQVGPNVMLAILESYDSLDEQAQAAMKQQMQQMINQVESQQGTAEGATGQQTGLTQEEALFGKT